MIAWAFEALLASTLLMVLVLVLRGPVRRAFGVDAAYALWLLPVLRLALPPLPAAWTATAVTPLRRAAEDASVIFIDLAGAAPIRNLPAAPATDYTPLLIGCWGLGAALFIGWHLVSHTRFVRAVLHGSKAHALGPVQVIETDAAAGPLAFGIWRKYVAFPRDFASRYEPEEQALALAHELAHHARGDLIANWVALVVLALHWFNPIAWRAFRAFRADQEMACDARVLSGRGDGLRHIYGRAIVKSAHGGAVSAACHLHTINDLKGRLRMLSTRKPSRIRLISGSALVGVMLLAGLGVTASGSAAAERLRTEVKASTGLDIANLDKPAAPTPPQPPVPPAPGSAVAPPAPPVVAQGDLQPPALVQAAPTPPAPPAPPVIAKHKRVIIRGKDGKIQTIDVKGDEDLEAAIARAIPDKKVRVYLRETPEIIAGNCEGLGEGSGSLVRTKKVDGKVRTIICTREITQLTAEAQRKAADAAELAANSHDIERNAMRSALSGLRTARASIQGNADMSAEARAEALKGIDKAISELESDIAKNN